jgi:hypothetical protein
MTTTRPDDAGWPIESRTCLPDAEMVELSLLLPGWQAAQMERLADSQGLTLGQLIRLLIRDCLTDRATRGPVSKRPLGNMAIPRGDCFDSQDESL